MRKARIAGSFCVIFCLLFSFGFFANEWRHTHASSIKTHDVDNLVFHCMDHRFKPIIESWIKKNCAGDADDLSLPGAAWCLNCENDPCKETVLTAISKAIDLHKITTIHLINHLDCGGYGGSAKHKDIKAETAFHVNELQRAAMVVSEHFPGIEVKLYLANFQGVERLSP